MTSTKKVEEEEKEEEEEEEYSSHVFTRLHLKSGGARLSRAWGPWVAPARLFHLGPRGLV